MFFKKDLLENFAICKGKDLCWSHFLMTLQAFRLKLHTGVFLWIPFFKTPPVADSALTYDLNGLKSRVNRHLLSFLNSFPIRSLSFSFSFTCNSMPCTGCSALHGFNLDQKKDTNMESVINSNLIFFIRPIEKSALAIHDFNGLSKITNLLDIKKSGTCRSSSLAPEVFLWKKWEAKQREALTSCY